MLKRSIPLGLALVAGLQGVAFADLKSKYQDEQKEEEKRYAHCLKVFESAQYKAIEGYRNDNSVETVKRYYVEDGNKDVWEVSKSRWKRDEWKSWKRNITCGHTRIGSMTIEKKCSKMWNGASGYYISCHLWQFAIESGDLVRYMKYSIGGGNVSRKVMGQQE